MIGRPTDRDRISTAVRAETWDGRCPIRLVDALNSSCTRQFRRLSETFSTFGRAVSDLRKRSLASSPVLGRAEFGGAFFGAQAEDSRGHEHIATIAFVVRSLDPRPSSRARRSTRSAFGGQLPRRTRRTRLPVRARRQTATDSARLSGGHHRTNGCRVVVGPLARRQYRGPDRPGLRGRRGLNRPGSDGGSQSMEDESHGSTQEVPRRVA